MTNFETVVQRAPRVVQPSASAPRVATSRAKRIFDLLMALTVLFFVLPVLLFVATAIKVQDGGPVLFRQRRTGLNNQPFVIYKFRTMTVAEDDDDIAQAKKNDARVTPLGRILRMFSVDELPQLFNVLKGEMSLVGPRPHALAHDHQWGAGIPGYHCRFQARPGITGLAQVTGLRGEVRGLDCVRARLEADLYYIENWSLKLELVVLLRTGLLLLRDPQAY
ncbi:sugar transferase [Phenylobacterium sp.]|uniref:sugar transferase n=1 Tax=Phenylobacterium sp. TaxID=1871053 RepID=UPI002C08A6A1|nr:sugar transferase [Phenylobacterium sp.]HVI33723.1 sugar transferase [Phenylobacterium sp.]